MAHPTYQRASLNSPEENDETMSLELQSWLPPAPQSWAGHGLDRLLPSQVEMGRSDRDTSYASYDYVTEDHSHSLPPCLPSGFHSYGCYGEIRRHSLPSSGPEHVRAEQPRSLHSFLPAPALFTPPLAPYPGHPNPPAYCRQCHLPQLSWPCREPLANRLTSPGYYGHTDNDLKGEHGSPTLHKASSSSSGTQLSQQQRKVFVTYEIDSEDHFKEVMKFVAVLRNNGFDTHIDVFEQQLNSISKIDSMERYLSEKDYLIIIIISPKYYDTVTGSNVSVEIDERPFNTVYIYKQLQGEFIQNSCRNFRLIPILFPGTTRCHVPAWLQNTLIYSWPRDHDDILRRLMRVEKYNPPPIGSLPTIVSIPI